ncbi:MAG: hypothetical protein Q8N71_04135 [candidate division Zixibacteria bacterium]|nr:hypothetical protein [candidate division Zixibacteria bacterium]
MPIASQIKSLTEDIEASYGARVVAVSDIIKETHQTLGSFHRAHQKMAGDLRDSLSTSERERMKDFATLIGDIKAAVESIEKDTTDLLSKFAQEHKEMARVLSSSLDESESTRIAEFKEMLKSIQSRQKEREEETAELLSDYQKDLSETKRHWQNLAKIMAAKRAGKPVPTPRAEMGVSKAVKEEAEEAFEGGEMKERVLAVIRAHPGGITLPEIGKALRVAYIRASKPLKELLMGMKVTKRDSEYLPA